MMLYLLLWDNGDMQKVAELLVPDNGKCGADIKQSCNVISATFPDSTFESFRHDSGISHSEGNVHEEGAV